MDCPSDEMVALASADFLAGNNWREVVAKAGYYGFWQGDSEV